jgi:hypothetical protein
VLTICYITSRKQPLYDWFAKSLERELGEDIGKVKMVVVDSHHPLDGREAVIYPPDGIGKFVHTEPKPTVWQGKYRLTRRDYWAASNSRNTCICHAEDGHVVFADDLSVLMPGWYESVKECLVSDYIMIGAYKKVLKLVVESGVAVSWTDFTPGIDSRLKYANGNHQVHCNGGWLFGSFCAPVEALLKINGYDEDCDSVSGEDYIAGMMMEKAGYRFVYDTRAMTLESEEGHHLEPPVLRIDKGTSPNDKSHAILNMVKGGRAVSPNYFGEGGIRALRDSVLSGLPFPLINHPDRDWFDGQPLSEM